MGHLFKRFFIALMRFLPLQRILVFESHPDFSDNSLALFTELRRRGVNKRYKMYWIRTFHTDERPGERIAQKVDTIQKEPKTFWEALKRAYILNCCHCIIDCNSFIYKRRKKQVRIHLGHGMPIKIDLEYSRKFGDCDKYMVLSEFWKELYRKEIHVPEHCLCASGYPRNDVLVHRRENVAWLASVRSFRKVVVWMPTYRQHRLHVDQAMENHYPYGMPAVHNRDQLECLHDLLKRKEVLLLFRPHPVQELSVFEQQEFSHIRIANDGYLDEFGMTLYELLGNSDALITDYSSVYFDYLLTDRPIALTIADIDTYFQYFTPAFPDYKAYIKGFYVETFEELLAFLAQTAAGEDPCREERMAAKRMFHSDVEGNCAEQIADMLADEYGIRG